MVEAIFTIEFLLKYQSIIWIVQYDDATVMMVT